MILIVDDDSAVRSSLSFMLKRAGYEVKTAPGPRGIHMESTWTPAYNSAYIEGIGNLYEFDCGAESGWMYAVNGWFPNYGCSQYALQDGDTGTWVYTCELGRDVGSGGWTEGE